jgi:hexosaminidase
MMKTVDLLIPVKRLRGLPGRFAWGKRPVLCSPFAEDRLPLRQLGDSLALHAGAQARHSRTLQKPSALVIRRHGWAGELEGYHLVVGREGVEILAATSAGAYYAVQTLRELVRLHRGSLPFCRIDDAPDFRRRGVYLDCSRGKVPTIDTLKQLVEYLASLKVNELQLYVENVFTFKSHPDIGRGFSRFTPAELLAVQDHCQLHHMRFVPSLTSFGHFEKILGLPAYARLAEKPGASTLCALDPGAIRLVADMMSDFVPLFADTDFNVCGDEPWELGTGRSKPLADRVGKGMVYLDYIKKLHKLCGRHGKRMNLWSDIVLNHPEMIPQIPTDVVMLNWDYEPDGKRIARTDTFAKAGLDVVVCPGTSSWQSHGTRLRNAMENVRVFANVGRRYGVEGLLNTDWGDCGHRNPLGASFHGYAHGAAHAWHGRGVADSNFTATFCRHVLGTGHADVARLITELGAIEETVGGHVFHMVGEALDPKRSYTKRIIPISPVSVRPGFIDAADPAACRRVREKLDGLVGKAARRVGKDALARFVLEDLTLAAQLDQLGCARALAAKRFRAGNGLPASIARALAAETEQTAKVFERNWLKRNKPSRLRDNLQLFRQGQAECRRLTS